MKFVLNSEFFKSARFKKVKSPAEFVTGTVKLAGQHREAHQFGLELLPRMTNFMGQQLLNPPTVEGWHTGREWIDSAFLVERVNFAAEKLGDVAAPGIVEMTQRIGDGRSAIGGDELFDACLSEMGDLDLASRTRDVLLAELSLPDQIDCEGDELRASVAKVAAMVGASREYQFA